VNAGPRPSALAILSGGEREAAMDALNRFLSSKTWAALSIACVLYALYESFEHLRGGHDLEGALDLVLLLVVLINLVNKVKWLGSYFKQLAR
jgi:hypothetical protein